MIDKKTQKLWKGKGYRYYLHYKKFTMYNKLFKNKKKAKENKRMWDETIKINLHSSERGRIKKL
jgi:hypothetical protein